MREKLLSAAVALYLFACILLGGSAQGIAFHLALQLAGIALIAWAIATPRPMPAAPAARALMWLVAAMLLLVALQWLPLPFGLWRALPGRAIIADQLRLLGQYPATIALSLDPAASWSSAFQLIPPLAILIAIVRLGAYRAPWLIASLAAATLVAILLGIAQVASPDPLTSPFYLFPQANRGVATGTFANANHFAILLLTTIPFLAAGAAIAGRGSSKDAHGRHAILAGATIVVLTGLTLSRSLAVASLALPVCGASLLILHRPKRSARRIGAGILIAPVMVLLALALIPLAGGKTALSGSATALSVDSRLVMARNTLHAIGDHFPLGAGLGSFVRLYPRYEDPAAVGPEYVVHAHDDYLELALETGLPGMLLTAAFLWWFVRRTVAVWRAPVANPIARAATIAVAALLAHSLVDYPLRTSAMAAVFALGVALLADPRSRRREFAAASDPEPGPARHLSL